MEFSPDFYKSIAENFSAAIDARSKVISTDDYYSSIDPSATDDDLKGKLQTLISQKTVLSYDDVWNAFGSVDKFLPGYPCSSDSDQIPDIYSAYCWTPEKDVDPPGRGECGNY